MRINKTNLLNAQLQIILQGLEPNYRLAYRKGFIVFSSNSKIDEKLYKSDVEVIKDKIYKFINYPDLNLELLEKIKEKTHSKVVVIESKHSSLWHRFWSFLPFKRSTWKNEEVQKERFLEMERKIEERLNQPINNSKKEPKEVKNEPKEVKNEHKENSKESQTSSNNNIDINNSSSDTLKDEDDSQSHSNAPPPPPPPPLGILPPPKKYAEIEREKKEKERKEMEETLPFEKESKAPTFSLNDYQALEKEQIKVQITEIEKYVKEQSTLFNDLQEKLNQNEKLEDLLTLQTIEKNKNLSAIQQCKRLSAQISKAIDENKSVLLRIKMVEVIYSIPLLNDDDMLIYHKKPNTSKLENSKLNNTKAFSDLIDEDSISYEDDFEDSLTETKSPEDNDSPDTMKKGMQYLFRKQIFNVHNLTPIVSPLVQKINNTSYSLKDIFKICKNFESLLEEESKVLTTEIEKKQKNVQVLEKDPLFNPHPLDKIKTLIEKKQILLEEWKKAKTERENFLAPNANASLNKSSTLKRKNKTEEIKNEISDDENAPRRNMIQDLINKLGKGNMPMLLNNTFSFKKHSADTFNQTALFYFHDLLPFPTETAKVNSEEENNNVIVIPDSKEKDF